MNSLSVEKSAFITGAASGIGRAFAYELASQGYHLFLMDKNHEKLTQTASEISGKYRVSVQTYIADLSKTEDISRIEKEIASIKDLEILVNNAGFGTKGNFATVDIAKSIAMINVHVIAATSFTHAALQGMILRKKGAIINVSSGAAFLYTAAWTIYNASKMYLVSFTKSLSYELKGTGVKVQVLCPGMTKTQFHHTEEFAFDTRKVADYLWQAPETVARKSLRALPKDKVIYIPGILNKLIWGRGIFTPITSRVSTKMNQ